MVLALMRLAVMLAMQPVANDRRTLEMSILSERMGTPTASTRVTGASTNLRIRSRS
ncbi:MAG: hypothetical protein BWX70_03372 [Verrucomicrobia bacterium ADurb.Bin070]|nr:MAG: hypothetical protein BWX70_03372 [Verrucomicrobia bacterium ADurb.Bin070]